VLGALLIVGCTRGKPSDIDDARVIFRERPAWRQATRAAAKRWGPRESTILAIIRHESSFRPRARPRRRLFAWPPLSRPSSAAGYAQALDATWREYCEATGRRQADRDNFADAADFVGWYLRRSQRLLDLPLSNVKHHYLAYHVGWTGYRQRRYRGKPRMLDTAKLVAERAREYHRQMRGDARD
jgi:hypothetical protein